LGDQTARPAKSRRAATVPIASAARPATVRDQQLGPIATAAHILDDAVEGQELGQNDPLR
jgi:hypothetical protein